MARLADDLRHGRWPGDFARPQTADHVRVRPPGGSARSTNGSKTVLRVAASPSVWPPCSPHWKKNGRFRLLAGDGQEEQEFDHVFSTIPLEGLARLAGMDGVAGPEYMDLYSLFYECPGEPAFPHNVLHNFSASGQWKRLTVFSRYYGTAAGAHWFTVEGDLEGRARQSSHRPR